MNFIILLTIVSSICSIISLLITLYVQEYIQSEMWAIVVFILTFVSGLAIHYNSKLEKLKNIHKKAKTIYDDYQPFSSNIEFVEESIVFLEENKDLYPDAYKRAKNYYSQINHSRTDKDRKSIESVRGIIKGIATLNHE